MFLNCKCVCFLGVCLMSNELLEVINIIETHPKLYKIFKSCPYEILRCWKIKEYRSGSFVCRQGEMIDSFFILVKGSTKIYFVNENGKKYHVQSQECGDVIGEMELIHKTPIACFVEAYMDITVLKIKREIFVKWVTEDRNISLYLIDVLSNKFYNHSLKTGKDILNPLKVRVCAFLLSRYNEQTKNSIIMEIPINKEKLSEELGVTARSIHRVLHNLQVKNIIDVKTESIIVKDFDKLTAEAETKR